MFANLGWEHLLVLLIAGLVVLGPERLPGAIRWTATAVRQVREYLSSATSGVREEFGPEFDDFREPVAELQRLRGMTPRAAFTKHLLDGDDSLFAAMSGASEQSTQRFDHRDGSPPEGRDSSRPDHLTPPAQLADKPQACPPFDTDAT